LVVEAARHDYAVPDIPIEFRPRTVLEVSKTGDGGIEIALVGASTPDGRRTLLLRPGDVPVLIAMLRRQVEDDGSEDLSTIRSLRPVT
jgi:hypothetical protein